MALWKDSGSPKREATVLAPDPVAPASTPMSIDTPVRSAPAWNGEPARRADTRESVIGSQLAIEGKIEGAGHVRIAGRFTGDVTVDGNLTIEPGAVVTGGVKAQSVVIGGELNGNVIEAGSVELLAGGVLNGDLRAGTFTVAAGSRMRGRVEFGWQDGRAPAGRDGRGENGL